MGFYMLGTMCFVKSNFVTEKYVVGGASAGSVVAAYTLSKKKDWELVSDSLLPFVQDVQNKGGWAWPKMMDIIHSSFYNADCDYERGFVSTSLLLTTFPWIKNELHDSFSSHFEFVEKVKMSCFIPLVSGGLTYSSHFDGCFTGRDSVPKDCEVKLEVTPTMWGREWNARHSILPSGDSMESLFVLGYLDAMQHSSEIRLKRRAWPGRVWKRGNQAIALRRVVREMKLKKKYF